MSAPVVKGIRYVQFHQHRHLHSVRVIRRPLLEQVADPWQGAQNQKVLAKDIEVYDIA